MLERICLSVLLSTLLVLPRPAAAQQVKLFQATAGGDKPLGRIAAPPMRRKIELKGSRREVLNFMLKIAADGCGDLVIAPFQRQGDGLPLAASVRLYRMETIYTTQMSFPAALRGDNYDPLVPEEGQLCPPYKPHTWYWGDLEIPRSAEPGVYRSSLKFGDKRVRLTLTVWRMTMPEVPTFPGYAELIAGYLDLGHYGSYRGGDAALITQYTEEMQAHRMYPIKSFTEWPPVVTSAGTPILDIFNYPDAARAYYNINTSLRPRGLHFDLPGIPFTNQYDANVPEYYQAMQNTLTSINRPGEGLVFLWDEPGPQDLSRLIEYAKLVKQNAPGVKVMVTVPGLAELAPYVDIFVPAPDYWGRFGVSQADYERLQQTGHEVWWYISCMSHGCTSPWNSGSPDLALERPSVYVRSIAWTAMKYNVTAFWYYAVNYAYRGYPERDPWIDNMDFTGNGDGTLFYPGRPGIQGLTRHMPVPSIRLKVWRESSFDGEYIAWMKSLPQKPEWWQKGFDKLVQQPKLWSKRYAAYQKLRDRCGAYLNTLP